ncbi:MAG: nitroreductase [Leptolyngbya sp. SIO1D8]|nr:nitroreductase [Leptolyngbya sp. SIO1D8]
MLVKIPLSISSKQQLKTQIKAYLNRIVLGISPKLHARISGFYIKRLITNLKGDKILNDIEYKDLEKLFKNYLYDFKRFLTWAVLDHDLHDKTSLKAYITKEYHRIEKRLAFKEPRVGFRPEIARGLASKTKTYLEKYGADDTIRTSTDCLEAYYGFNLRHGVDDANLRKEIDSIKSGLNLIDTYNLGGTLELTRESVFEKAKINLKDFFESRYSIRDFSPEPVDRDLLKRAVSMAQKTPSVCNRQSSKVYLFDDETLKNLVLQYQNGNKGFGDKAKAVLVVTSDLRHFFSIGERYQGWIDGGMFSMSLVYALHSLGLGTCCLNWSVEKHTDRALKTAAGIDDYESIIMMIAVGHLPEKFKVAKSSRKSLEEVLYIR